MSDEHSNSPPQTSGLFDHESNISDNDSTHPIVQSEQTNSQTLADATVPTQVDHGRDVASAQARSRVFVQVRQRLEELKGELLSVLDVLDARVRRILLESQQGPARRGEVPPWKREYKFTLIGEEDLGIEGTFVIL